MVNQSSCVVNPIKTQFIQLYAWQVKFCCGNHCAAMMLSIFIAWHDWKMVNDEYYRRANDIAETHGDGRPHNQNAYLYFTLENFIQYLLGAYGKNAINAALDLLAELGVISIHKNPNKRYHFDKTKYFLFYPEVCNAWIAENYPVITHSNHKSTQPIDNYDMPKREDAFNKKGIPSTEMGRAITNTTNNINQSVKANRYDLLIDQNNNKTNFDSDTTNTIQPVLDALIEKGLPSARLQYPDVVETLQRLQQAGATLDIFVNAFDVAARTTQSRGFGINYLAKVVQDILDKSRQKCQEPPPRSQHHSRGMKADKSEYIADLSYIEALMNQTQEL